MGLTGGCETTCFRSGCEQTVYRESAYIHQGMLFCNDTCQQQHSADATTEQRSDMIKPDYYHTESVYEPFKIIRYYGLNFFEGNALKYLLRAGKKNKGTRLEDLQKAATYIADEITETKEQKNK